MFLRAKQIMCAGLYASLVAMMMFVTLWTSGPAHATDLGTVVTNRAFVTYDSGTGPVTVVTNEVSFVIEAARTPSEIEFFRYAPTASDAMSVRLNGSDYAPNGNLTGPFTPTGAPVTAGGAILDFSGNVPLVPATMYLSGELMIVRVRDIGQNGDPTRIETVTVRLDVTTGDEIVLQLYESGPDTGEFYAWIPSSSNTTPINDPVLTTGREAEITATYIDPFDATEVSIDTALVDPYGRVFDSITGELIDGAIVTVIDTATGQPADVFGIDGISEYPSTVTTGSQVTDASGLIYNLAPGEFRFPLMATGTYSLRVTPPDGYLFTSSLGAGDFVALPNAPYEIIAASYGDTFTLTGLGPLNLDIPVDPVGNLVLRKSVTSDNVGIGDFIAYQIEIENRDTVTVPVNIRDYIPEGFRYVAGSANIDGATLPDPVISLDASRLAFDLAPLPPGDSVTLNYVLEVASGADLGLAVNEAHLVDAFEQRISGVARASVYVRDELLSSRSTIIGRIAEDACNADEEWARSIEDGIGVKGVRLYLETGAYAVTDEHGLYHFEGVRPGTHVVQVDEETLPPGLEPMICEESTRYAGRGTSKFVDVKGGSIWRANFYLKRNENFVAEKGEELFSDLTEYKFYDDAWLDAASKEIEWVYPDTTRTPSSPSVNIGIKHHPEQTVALYLNGNPVPSTNIQSRDTDKTRTNMITRWRGVDILEGENRFEAVVTNVAGLRVAKLNEIVYFNADIDRAIAMPDQSILVADGRTNPVIAVRLENGAGRAVHAGRILKVDILEPYRAKDANVLEGENPLTLPLSARGGVAAGPGGIARIQLEPTLRTGKVTVEVTLDDGRKEQIFMYLKPEKRDWILVGLAEASVGLERVRDNMANTDDEFDLIQDGRVAFFAKGMIKGDWLLTLAADTDKRRGGKDGELFEYIDPNAYYTLYGDRTYQDHEAESRYPLYVKLEKGTFFAMFGDYDTDMTDARLGRYNRRLSGLKSVHAGERLEVMVFAAETNQGFNKDEIAADGTSGPFNLSARNILRNSEEIYLETRDRFRLDEIIDRVPLVRYLDYDIDYFTGELIFRLPVPATDPAFNPVTIVADYETSEDTERNYTYGGRVSRSLFGGIARMAATYVHEGGSAQGADQSGDLAAIDVVTRLTPNTEVRMEYGWTRRKNGASSEDATAYLVEVLHQSERLAAQAYFRQEDGGYGLGQQTSRTNGLRRFGAEASWRLSSFEDTQTGRRGQQFIELRAFREENLNTGGTRDQVEAGFRHDGDRRGYSVALRGVRDKFAGGETRESMVAVLGLRQSFPDQGLTFIAGYEQPIGGKDDVSAHPLRATLGVDKRLGETATVSLRHEFIDGPNSGEVQNTSLGLRMSPWTGGEVTASTDHLTGDSGRRLGATIGVDQQWQINERWSASAGLTRHQVLSQSGTVRNPVEDSPVSPLESNLDYTAGYVGLGYRDEIMSASGRFEYRDSSDAVRYVTALAMARELSEKLSIAGAARIQNGDFTDGTDEMRADGRLGLAWRPRGEGLVVFNRLDLKYNQTREGYETAKLINNLGLNWMMNDRTQTSFHYGLKYVDSRVLDENYSGFTHLMSGETRFDVTEYIDLGLHASALYSGNSDTMSYAWGPSIGFTPIDNTWISLGYNVDGFIDNDFEAAEFTREGPYLKFRYKFDQHTAEGLLNRISPSDDTTCARRCVQ